MIWREGKGEEEDDKREGEEMNVEE